MGFKDAIKTCFGKYATFSGRAARSEYWWFFLFHMLLSVVPLVQLVTLATAIPMLAVSWRRMHDVGKSGLYLFLPLVLIPFAVIEGAIGGGLGPVSFVGFGLSLLAVIYVFFLLASRGRGDVAAPSGRFSPSLA